MEEKRSGKASSMKMVSRRSFIRGMAAAGAGAAFLSSGVKTSRNGVNGMGSSTEWGQIFILYKYLPRPS